MKKIAFVTVNFNGAKDTLELLKSVKKLDTKGIDFRFIIVDSTPNEWIGDSIKEKIPNLILLQSGENKGFAGNYNLGMKHAVAWGADYVGIINNDTIIPDTDLIKKLAGVLDKNSEASVVSPKIYFAPGYEFFGDRYKESDRGKVIWYAGGNFDWNNIQSVHYGIDQVDRGQFDSTGETGFVSGCCFLTRADILQKIGYFNEGFFAYFEDNDWQERILLSRGKLFYIGETAIYHKVSRTSGIGSPQTDYLITRNRLYFTFKYAKFRTKFAVIREAVRQLLFGRSPQKKAIIDFINGVKGRSPYSKDVKGTYKYPIRLSVLISNYKTAALTEKLLKSIYDAKSGFDPNKDEVLVVDDASGDNLEPLTKKYPKVLFLKNKTNKGFVASYNRLLELSRGEFILMLNSDIEVRPKALSALIETSKKFNDEAVLAGKLLFPDGSPQDSCFKLPTAWGAFKEFYLKIKGSYLMFYPKTQNIVRVEGAVMAAFFIPRKIFNKVGYLNRKLFMYFEDVDYCRSLKKENIPLYFCPNAVFFHYHGASGKNLADWANQWRRLIPSSKIYHGLFGHYLIFAILWPEQRIRRWLNSLLN